MFPDVQYLSTLGTLMTKPCIVSPGFCYIKWNGLCKTVPLEGILLYLWLLFCSYNSSIASCSKAAAVAFLQELWLKCNAVLKRPSNDLLLPPRHSLGSFDFQLPLPLKWTRPSLFSLQLSPFSHSHPNIWKFCCSCMKFPISAYSIA